MRVVVDASVAVRLLVDEPGSNAARGDYSKSWSQSVRLDGKPTSIGLGRYPAATLTMARDRELIDAPTS